MKQLLVFVLFAALFCWLMFSPIYKHVLVIRQALLQQEADYMLEIGASGRYGYVDGGMVQESRIRLSQYGFNEAYLEYDINSTSGAESNNPAAPLPRGTGLRLRISYPYENLLDIDRLIGLNSPSANARISGGGMKMSEYVPD
ncbi:hypothetical protein [Cohnella terricola]|uniref:Uncharacterized protein n=1 Tax=Cohnella terricola TaxID=1289167 RepID=A0A559J6F6_9BACL|nr:hypothetical protein [Cohnella terricola]TVX95465.1 hypothetical protein FPZ45_23350 [Cohnella terricola]